MNFSKKIFLIIGLIAFISIVNAVAPDVNIVKIDGRNAFTVLTLNTHVLSYNKDGNLTIDFNVSDADVNGGVGKLDANIDLRRIDTNARIRIVTDLNLASTPLVGGVPGLSRSGTYCNDANFGGTGKGAADTNIGSTCHWDINISRDYNALFQTDTNWVIDINVGDGSAIDQNGTGESRAGQPDLNFLIDNNAPSATLITTATTGKLLEFDVNEYASQASTTGIRMRINGAYSTSVACTTLAKNLRCSFTEPLLKMGDTNVFIDVNDDANNTNTKQGTITINPDVNIVKIDGRNAFGVRTLNTHVLSYNKDGNLTIDFNVFAVDINGDANARVDANIDLRRIDTNARVIVVRDLNLMSVTTPGSNIGTYCNDINFFRRGGTDINFGSTCRYDINIMNANALGGTANIDTNWVIDINVNARSASGGLSFGLDQNTTSSQGSTPDLNFLIDNNAPSTTLVSSTSNPNKLLEFDVNEFASRTTTAGVKVTVNGTATTSTIICTQLSKNLRCSYTELLLRNGNNTVLIDANDDGNNTATQTNSTITINPDANIVKIDGRNAFAIQILNTSVLSQKKDGNLTIDFNVFAADVNGVGNVDANIDLRRTDTGAKIRVISDLNLAKTPTAGGTTGTYCNDVNFANKGGADINIGTTCHWDINTSALLTGANIDTNWVIDINVNAKSGTATTYGLDQNIGDLNFLIDNNAPTVTVRVVTNGGTTVNKYVEFDVNEFASRIVAAGVKVTVNGTINASTNCTQLAKNLRCGFTEPLIKMGNNVVLIDANDDGNNTATQASTAFRVDPDANIVKIDGRNAFATRNLGIPAFGYFRDGNLTIDFNVFAVDVNGVGNVDANIEMRRYDNNGVFTKRIVSDLNLARTLGDVAGGAAGAYCDDVNFATDVNTGSTCHWDININALTAFGLVASDTNWFIDINVDARSNAATTYGIDQNFLDLNFEIDNNAPIGLDANILYASVGGTDINGYAGYLNDANVPMRITYTDANSVAFSCSGTAYTGKSAANDYNYLAAGNGVFYITDFNTAIGENGCSTADGNRSVFIRFKDTAGNIADFNGLDGNSVFLDRTKPVVISDANNYIWQNTDANAQLWCVDGNGDFSNSQCKTLNYRRDTNGLDGNSMSAWIPITPTRRTSATGLPDINIFINTDGNYSIDFNARDLAGNNNDSNVQTRFILVDKTIPVWQSDLLVDVNQEDTRNTVDRMIPRNQKFTVRVRQTADATVTTADFNEVRIVFTDLNKDINILFVTKQPFSVNDNNIDINRIGNSRTWFLDFNSGSSWDVNFIPKTIRIKVKDTAGNWTNSSAATDTNVTDIPLVFFAFTWPSTAGLDMNSASTNFQDINNFADVNLLFSRGGLGRLSLFDVNISTAAQAAKLTTLGTALSVQRVDSNRDGLQIGDINIQIIPSVFSDINKRAQLTMYNLPYAAFTGGVGIRQNDGNCGAYCFNTSYSSNQLDFNVYGFSSYLPDGTPPRILASNPGGPYSNGTSVNLNVYTDENATCRFGSSDVAYDAMAPGSKLIDTNNGKTHGTSVISNYAADPTNRYYIRCVDSVGNKSIASTLISFTAQSTGGSTTTTGTTSPVTTAAPSTTTTTPAATTPIAPIPEIKTEVVSTTPIVMVAPTVAEIRTVVLDVLAEVAKAANQIVTEEQKTIAVEKANTAATVTEVLTRAVEVVQSTPSGGGIVTYASNVSFTVKNESDKKLENVKVIEVIPKEVAQKASEIKSSLKFRIIKDDPIIEFVIPEVQPKSEVKVIYTVDKKLDENATKNYSTPIVADLVQTEIVDICAGINPNDNNPCTIDSCVKGFTKNEPVDDGTNCGIEMICRSGECIKKKTAAITEEETGETAVAALPSGEKAKPTGQADLWLLVGVVIVLIAIVYLLIPKKKKTKLLHR